MHFPLVNVSCSDCNQKEACKLIAIIASLYDIDYLWSQADHHNNNVIALQDDTTAEPLLENGCRELPREMPAEESLGFARDTGASYIFNRNRIHETISICR